MRLKEAVLNRDLVTVKHLLSSGANPNIKYDGNGTTLLHIVNTPEIALELIKFGADIEAKDSFGWTPLCSAVGNVRNPEVVKILLSFGAKVNVRMEIANTPLHLAPNLELTEVLLSHGAEVNVIDKYGRAPIHSALIDGKGYDVFMAILRAGADVNVKMARFENSLLHYADSLSYTRELLSRGAHVNAIKIDGQTPLHCAVRHMKEAAVVRELLKWGACVNSQDNEGETALGLAMRCYNKNIEAIKELLKYGADINFVMFDCALVSYCTIIESAMFSDLPCAKLLVKLYLLKNWDGRSAIEIEFDVQIHHYNANILLKYKNDCISEIVQMKSDLMFIKNTLYELVVGNQHHVQPLYGSYRAIKMNLKNKYPIYHDVIMEELEKGLERGRLLSRLEELYTSLKLCKDLEQELKLNSDCLLLIAGYLSDIDILNIIITFENYLFSF